MVTKDPDTGRVQSRFLPMPESNEILSQVKTDQDALLYIKAYCRAYAQGRSRGLAERNFLLADLLREGVITFKKMQLILGWSAAHLRRVLLEQGLTWPTIKAIERNYRRSRARLNN